MANLVDSAPFRVLGPHEPLLRARTHERVDVYPLLEGDSFSKQRGGVIKDNIAIADAKQYRSLRQFTGHDHPNTCAPPSTWEMTRRKPHKQCSGLWLFGGFAIDHFGHFIADNCHRFWPLLEQTIPDIEGILFIGFESDADQSQPLSSFQKDIISYLTNRPTQTILATQSLTIERLIVPTQANTLGPLSEPQKHYTNLLTQHRRRRSWRINRKKIYISRSKLRTQSCLIGEHVIEKILNDAGFLIFHPEEHSFEHQINLYKTADMLVFCEGSAIHTLDLAGDIRADVVIISRGGLKNRRNQSLQSCVKHTAHSCTLFSDVQRHPAIRHLTNSRHESIPAHWECGTWLNYQQLTSFLQLLNIQKKLIPSHAEYKASLSPYLLNYITEANETCATNQKYSARALSVLLKKIKSL
ncbi:glycosyltransferase family 61 protein [Synechococcus sp. CS-197]|nr:glycosyltransferase family 61 protein [Synechococcus sp. CS-197]